MCEEVCRPQPWSSTSTENHYYESDDAFTRYADRSLRTRGVSWAEVGGKRQLLVGGKLNSYIANPMFDPVAKPGALYDWYRGNTQQHQPFAKRSGFSNRSAPSITTGTLVCGRWTSKDSPARCCSPPSASGSRTALKDDPEACASVFGGFNRWLAEDWGYDYQGRLFAVPYVPLLDPLSRRQRTRPPLIAAGAFIVNVRSAPVPVPGGYRSPFDPAYDPFWRLAADAGTHRLRPCGRQGVRARWSRCGNPVREKSSLFRSPLRGIVTKGRAVADFYAAAICHKAFERFPELKMASVENGAGWAPDLLHRLSDAANRNPGYFADHPCETFGQHVWITPFWEDHIDELVADLFTSIACCLVPIGPTQRAPASRPTSSAESLAGMGEGDVRRIARGNVLELLGLSL